MEAGGDYERREPGHHDAHAHDAHVHESASTLFDEHFYKIVVLAAASVIGVATCLYHWLEDWSWVDSLYFSVVAVTTVGFGDLSPSTDGTKILTVVYVLTGIGVITTFINVRLQHNRTRRFNRRG